VKLSTRTRVKRIKQKLFLLQSELEVLQEQCNHLEEVEVKYVNSGDGFHPSSFAIFWHCIECDKRWSTDQEYETVRKLRDIKIVRRVR